MLFVFFRAMLGINALFDRKDWAMTESQSACEFLETLGVKSDILLDVLVGDLIVIRTQDYERRRRQIDAWFTFVRQIGDHSYFKIRMRGSGTSA